MRVSSIKAAAQKTSLPDAAASLLETHSSVALLLETCIGIGKTAMTFALMVCRASERGTSKAECELALDVAGGVSDVGGLD